MDRSPSVLNRVPFGDHTGYRTCYTGDVETTPQSRDEGASHTVDDFRSLCEIDPDERVRAKEFLDRLRALTFPPFDNAYVDVDGEQYYVDVDIRPANETTDETPGGRLTSY